MTKQEICDRYKPCGEWVIGWCRLVVHHIEHGIEERLYCAFHHTCGISYHRLLVHYTNSGIPYVLFNRRRYRLDECIRIYE